MTFCSSVRSASSVEASAVSKARWADKVGNIGLPEVCRFLRVRGQTLQVVTTVTCTLSNMGLRSIKVKDSERNEVRT